jgi:hypothetical protein
MVPSAAQGSCRAGSKPAIIGGNFKCLRVGQACKARYQASYHKYRFRCVSGRLRKWSPPAPPAPPEEPLPPPPPPPLPPAQPGHYKGSTSQLTTFDFDVTADGYKVTNLVTGQVNVGCTPHFNLYGGQINLGSYAMPIGTDSTFGVEYADNGAIGGTTPYAGRTKITGHFNGPTAVGTLEVTLSFASGGIAYACGSGLQTWTVTRIG